MRAPTRTAVKGLEKRECCPWTWSHCMGQWRCPPRVGTMGGRYSHCRTRETWGDGRAGAGAKPSLAEDVACWGTHETRSLTECALKTVVCAVPVPALSLPSPASVLASSTNTKPPTENSEKGVRNGLSAPLGYVLDELCRAPPAGQITGTHPRRVREGIDCKRTCSKHFLATSFYFPSPSLSAGLDKGEVYR